VDKPGAAVFPSRDNSDIPKATQGSNDHVRGVSKYALSSAAVLDLALYYYLSKFSTLYLASGTFRLVPNYPTCPGVPWITNYAITNFALQSHSP